MKHQKVDTNNAQLSLLPPNLLEQISSTTTENKLQTGTLQALKLLAVIETNREFLALLLELGEFRVDHLRYLMGPLVFHRTPWAETVPDWLKTACIQDRFETIIDEYERALVGEHATATEILTYIPHSALHFVTHILRLKITINFQYIFLSVWVINMDNITCIADYSKSVRS